jgi:hypothetical protein
MITSNFKKFHNKKSFIINNSSLSIPELITSNQLGNINNDEFRALNPIMSKNVRQHENVDQTLEDEAEENTFQNTYDDNYLFFEEDDPSSYSEFGRQREHKSQLPPSQLIDYDYLDLYAFQSSVQNTENELEKEESIDYLDDVDCNNINSHNYYEYNSNKNNNYIYSSIKNLGKINEYDTNNSDLITTTTNATATNDTLNFDELSSLSIPNLISATNNFSMCPRSVKLPRSYPNNIGNNFTILNFTSLSNSNKQFYHSKSHSSKLIQSARSSTSSILSIDRFKRMKSKRRSTNSQTSERANNRKLIYAKNLLEQIQSLHSINSSKNGKITVSYIQVLYFC